MAVKHTTMVNPVHRRTLPAPPPPSPPATKVSPVEIYNLAAMLEPTDIMPVRALGTRAARAGQRQLAIELFRCVERRNGVTQLLKGQLRFVAEQLNAGAYAA